MTLKLRSDLKDIECNKCPAGDNTPCRAIRLLVKFVLKDDFRITKEHMRSYTYIPKDKTIEGSALMYNTQVFCLEVEILTSNCDTIKKKIPLSMVSEVNLV